MRRHATAALGAALLLLTACGGDGDRVTDQPIDETPDGQPLGGAEDEVTDPPEGDPIGSSDPLLGPEVDTAIDDVVQRTGASRDEVLITVTELVTWPDGAAGCPEPGMVYTQALVEGYRIVLEVDGEEYHYVGAEGSDPTYCEDPQEPVD